MSRTRRYAYAVLGTTCLALGALGVVVPGLPTTVFILAASWLYARSCPALERRLRQTRWLGEILARFEEGRGMTARAKAISLGSMWAGIAAGAMMTASLSPLIPAVMAASGLVGSGVILLYVPTDTPLLRFRHLRPSPAPGPARSSRSAYRAA